MLSEASPASIAVEWGAFAYLVPRVAAQQDPTFKSQTQDKWMQYLLNTLKPPESLPYKPPR